MSHRGRSNPRDRGQDGIGPLGVGVDVPAELVAVGPREGVASLDELLAPLCELVQVRLDPLLRNHGYEREDYRPLVPDSTSTPGDDTRLRFDTRRHGSDDARAVHEAVGRDPAGIEYTAAIAGALDGREVVVSRDGEPIGAAGWYVHDDETEGSVARFTHVGVRPDAQGEGVGAELVRAVVDRCPLPAERIVVCATDEHVGFYESIGFVRIASLWRFARLP
jgi:GNAT superfamily N-acetyltransferase